MTITVHNVNYPGGWCRICGETEEWIIASGSGAIEYDTFTLAVPPVEA